MIPTSRFIDRLREALGNPRDTIATQQDESRPGIVEVKWRRVRREIGVGVMKDPGAVLGLASGMRREDERSQR